MKINEIITESKTKTKKLRESTEVAELGRAMMDMAITNKDDEVSNNMSTLGDTLTRFGTRLGPKNIKDVVKQTGLQPETIRQYMQAAQQYLEKHGPVRTGADVGDDEEEVYRSYNEADDTKGKKMSQKTEAFQRLVEIREEMEDLEELLREAQDLVGTDALSVDIRKEMKEMKELIREAENLVRTEFKREYPNGEAYWITHFKRVLSDMGYPIN